MKEFCGYKSLDGKLHETKETCEKADLEFKIKEIKKKFEQIDDYIIRKIHDDYTISTGKNYISNYVLEDIIISIFANKKEELLAIYKQGDLMKKELDELHKEYSKSNYISKWWLRLKWWK